MSHEHKNTISSINAVLFDLDGVLINSYNAWFHLFNRTLEYFGFSVITEPVFRAHWGQSTKKDIEIFMPGKTLNEVRRFFIEHYSEYLSYITVDTDAQEILRFLKDKGYCLGCVTNSHRIITDSILQQHALQSYFSIVLTADEVQHPKPAPDLILDACKHLEVSPRQTAFVGDTLADLEAGTCAGCIMIGYRISCPHTVQNLLELRTVIPSLSFEDLLLPP